MENVITSVGQTSGNQMQADNQVNDSVNQSFDINYDALANDISGDSTIENPQDGVSSSIQQEGDKNLEPEIDEKFKHLPAEEARYRTIQSRYDKLYNLHQQIATKNAEYEKVVGLLDAMLEDENLLATFVNQVRPGLIQQRDFKDVIRHKIVEKFGEDYKPTLTRLEAERDDPGGTDWKYYKFLDQLEKEYSNSSLQPAKTVEEYIKQKQLSKQQEQERMKEEYETVKKKLNASDEELRAAIEWGNNISLEKLLVVHRYLRKVPNKAGVSVETAPGKSVGSSLREQFLKGIYGNNINI